MYSYRTLTFDKGILRISNPLKEIESHLKHQQLYYVFNQGNYALVMSLDATDRKYYV